MKTRIAGNPGTHWQLLAFSAALLAFPLSPVPAVATELANIPLAESGSATVLPNIFFIFDNSGSMQQNYMPEYVPDRYCRDNFTEDSNTDGSLDECYFGDPPYMASGFNGIAYNPAVSYLPPVDAAGNVKAGHNGWLASSLNWTVPRDGYGILTTGTTNLTTGFTDRLWCDSSNSTTCNTVARRKKPLDASNNYIYPDATYRYLKEVNGPPFYYTATVEWCSSRNNAGVDRNFGTGTCQSKQTSVYQYVKYSNWRRVDIVPATTSYDKAATRTDCVGSACTYNEEMANFANWHAWYRTRQQMMKTAMSRAFKDVRGTPNEADPTDVNYFHARIGYTTISTTGTTDGTGYLAINNFDGNTVGTTTQKGTFYDRLFKANGSSYTPLRGALTKAGRIYAGMIGTDPVQYSCQKNYTILSTDGYWNTNTETATYKALKVNGTSAIGNMDGAVSGSCNSNDVVPICNDSGTCFEPTTTAPAAATSTYATATLPACDKLNKSNTLADIAYYYYHTDLRPAGADGKTCISRPSATLTDCTNNVTKSGDDNRLDDVATWQHMTTFTIGLGVDGNLSYETGYRTSSTGDFKDIMDGNKNWPDPTDTEDGDRIDDLWHAAVNGRGTYFSARDPATLTSSLEEALKSISSSTGSGAAAATANLNMTEGDDNSVYLAKYTTVDWTSDILAYTLTGSGIGSSTTWQAASLLNGMVSGTCGDVEARTIYTGASTRKPFTWGDLDLTERGYFDNSKLSQYGDWDSIMKADASGQLLLNYIRGHNRYEDRTRDGTWQSACSPYHRYYRTRKAILGDIVHSQPIYIAAPWQSLTDADYDSYKAANASRSPRLYVGANDGMLHAFNAETGNEVWAYVPPTVMPDLYRLADSKYADNHHYFVDGPLSEADIFDGSWKTILLGGLGKGGRGIFALDVTGTGTDYPKVMWNFTAANDPDLGYTYGAPLTTKLKDGTWVVVVASGYNNIPGVPNTGDYPASSGRGYVFVLRASDGAVLKKIATGATGNPGLANLEVEVGNVITDLTAVSVYGGDLQGNLWHFDIEAGTARKVASLGQPIQAAPVISTFDDGTGNIIKVLYFGTGRYLGKSDLDTTNIGQQYIYAIKDDGSTLVSPGSLTSRNMTDSSVFDWSHNMGWSIALGGSELVYLPGQLFANSGVLGIASVIPLANECKAGGTGYLYQLDFSNGFALGAEKLNSPFVGFSYFTETTPSGAVKGKVLGLTADGTPVVLDRKTRDTGDGGSGTTPTIGIPTRIMWRELPSE